MIFTLFVSMTMSFEYSTEAAREFKKLAGKYKTLEQDIKEFEKVLSSFPTGYGKHFNVLSDQRSVIIVKARLFSRALKGASDLRVVYAYYPGTEHVIYIEFYKKGKKDTENRQRYRKYFPDV